MCSDSDCSYESNGDTSVAETPINWRIKRTGRCRTNRVFFTNDFHMSEMEDEMIP